MTSKPGAWQSIGAQIIAITLTSVILTLWIDHTRFRSPVNALWMFGIPVLLAIVANPRGIRRNWMIGILIAASFVAMVTTARIFGLGP